MPGAYSGGVLMNGTPLGQAPDLLANMGLGCKGLPWTKTPAYFYGASATKKKVFKILIPGTSVGI